VGSNAVYIEEAGEVSSVKVRVGQEINMGDPVISYLNASKETVTVYSDQFGMVESLPVKIGDKLNPGSAVVRVTPQSTADQSQIVVCYVPLAQAKKLERGMQVNVSLDSLDSQSYGNMVARIINVDAYASSVEGMASVIGSGNNLDAAFTKDGAVVAVACELYTDPATQSGYFWSNAKGAKVEVSNGSLVTAKIVTEEVAPISKLFSKIAELWGD